MPAPASASRDTFDTRFAALRQSGVPGDDAYRLAREHRMPRIVQAIAQVGEYEERRGKPHSGALVARCLDEDWLPTSLFKGRSPAGPVERRAARAAGNDDDGKPRVRAGGGRVR